MAARRRNSGRRARAGSGVLSSHRTARARESGVFLKILSKDCGVLAVAPEDAGPIRQRERLPFAVADEDGLV